MLRKGSRACFVDNKRLLTGRGVFSVWHADMRPGAKLFNNLVKWYSSIDAGLYDLFGCHAWDSDVGCATQPMLAGISASNRIIHGFRSERRVYKDRLVK